MSLYPGKPRQTSDGQYVLDNEAIANSMAEAMEEEMKNVYKEVKKSSLPAMGQEDRRLLFVAIARGILKYLDHHEGAIRAVTGTGVLAHTHGVNLNVTMDNHITHV